MSNNFGESETKKTHKPGPVISRFLAALKEQKIIGVKCSTNEVIVPPMEHDPNTGEALTEFVDVKDQGEVMSWFWVRHPREKHTIRPPFAWAMIKLDGADTLMLHCVAATKEEQMSTGMRVQVRWAENRQGLIGDIVCFDPV